MFVWLARAGPSRNFCFQYEYAPKMIYGLLPNGWASSGVSIPDSLALSISSLVRSVSMSPS